MAEAKGRKVPDGWKQLGENRRVLECPLTAEDRERINEKLHGLMDSEARVEHEKKKANEAFNGRLADIKMELLTLHNTWKGGTREALVGVVVYRDDRRHPPEIVTVRADTGEELNRRAMTSKESQQLLQFDTGRDGGTEYVEELDKDDEATEFVAKQTEHEARVASLLEALDVTDIIAANNAGKAGKSDGDGDGNDKPKGKRGRKKKGDGEAAPAKPKAKGRGKRGGARPEVSEAPPADAGEGAGDDEEDDLPY